MIGNVVCADFSIADGERSRNGDDDRMAVVALKNATPEIERKKMWGGISTQVVWSAMAH